MLKEATKQQHDHLEGVVDVMNKMFSAGDYKSLLLKFYSFYAAIEPKISENNLSEVGIDFDARRKTALLEKDLKHLGAFDQINVTQSPKIQDIDTPAKAFGAMYVLEGATLGGQVIKRHLKEHLGISPESGGAFFTSYGENVGPMWKEFGAAITKFNEANPETTDETIAAAKETFSNFANSFQTNDVAQATS